MSSSSSSSSSATVKCCEQGCNKVLNVSLSSAIGNGKTTGTIGMCKCCRKPMCSNCLEYANKRATTNSFYVPYASYCDTCIWFDIG